MIRFNFLSVEPREAIVVITVLYEQRETRLPDAIAHGDELWLDHAAIEQATGWTANSRPEVVHQGHNH